MYENYSDDGSGAIKRSKQYEVTYRIKGYNSQLYSIAKACVIILFKLINVASYFYLICSWQAVTKTFANFFLGTRNPPSAGRSSSNLSIIHS